MKHLLPHIILPDFSPGREAREALEGLFVQNEFRKNDLLIGDGQICRRLYFIERGCVRGFYNIDGRDVSQWFGFEKDFVTSIRSFVTRSASREYIQVVEDSILWSVSREQLDELLQRFPELEKLVRLIYEQYYIRLEERYTNAHFKTAGERYDDLVQYTPHILQRMPLGYIASYLGVSAETLSRIRSKY